VSLGETGESTNGKTPVVEDVHTNGGNIFDLPPSSFFATESVQKPPHVIFDFSTPFQGDGSGDLGAFSAGSVFSNASFV